MDQKTREQVAEHEAEQEKITREARRQLAEQAAAQRERTEAENAETERAA